MSARSDRGCASRLRALGEKAEHAGGAAGRCEPAAACTGRSPSGAGRFRRARGERSSATFDAPAAAPPARMTMPLLAAPLAAAAAGSADAAALPGAAPPRPRRRALPSLSAKRASMPAGRTSSAYSTWPSPTASRPKVGSADVLLARPASSFFLPNCHEARPSARRSRLRVERRRLEPAMCSGSPCQARQRSQ